VLISLCSVTFVFVAFEYAFAFVNYSLLDGVTIMVCSAVGYPPPILLVAVVLFVTHVLVHRMRVFSRRIKAAVVTSSESCTREAVSPFAHHDELWECYTQLRIDTEAASALWAPYLFVLVFTCPSMVSISVLDVFFYNKVSDSQPIPSLESVVHIITYVSMLLAGMLAAARVNAEGTRLISTVASARVLVVDHAASSESCASSHGCFSEADVRLVQLVRYSPIQFRFASVAITHARVVMILYSVVSIFFAGARFLLK
jgi:hypothetical protein